MRRKEPSKHTGSPEGRFTLPKSAILRGRRNFQSLFSDSTLITSPSVNLRFAAYTSSSSGGKLLAGFVAPKRTGNAVKRNRTKRLLREAYRTNQNIVKDLPAELTREVHFLFIARRTGLSYSQVSEDVETLLRSMRSKLLAHQSPS